MWFQRFFATISRALPDRIVLRDEDALRRLNPQKFYVENVRTVLGISTANAQRICETAVRQGAFRRYVEVVCPNGSVAASAESEASLPSEVRCWTETHGEYEEALIPTRDLMKTVFYRLRDEAASQPVARAG